MITAKTNELAHRFSEEERRGLYRAIYERRDVRSSFRPDEIAADVLARLLDAAHHAPSVGFMQPWRFIVIRDRQIRQTSIMSGTLLRQYGIRGCLQGSK